MSKPHETAVSLLFPYRRQSQLPGELSSSVVWWRAYCQSSDRSCPFLKEKAQRCDYVSHPSSKLLQLQPLRCWGQPIRTSFARLSVCSLAPRAALWLFPPFLHLEGLLQNLSAARHQGFGFSWGTCNTLTE